MGVRASLHAAASATLSTAIQRRTLRSPRPLIACGPRSVTTVAMCSSMPRSCGGLITSSHNSDRSANQRHHADYELAGGSFLFSDRPFVIMPSNWHRGVAQPRSWW